MKKDDFLSDEFLKQFTTGQELTDFLKQVQTRGIEKMLEGELDAHLGYDKHIKSKTDNARNGYGKKKIKTSFGETEIQVPSDRKSSFNPIIVLKQVQSRGIEKMLEGMLDAHLGYDKQIKAKADNARNGYGKKKIKTSLVETEIQVP